MSGGLRLRPGASRLSRRTSAWLVDAVAPGRVPGSWEADPKGSPDRLCAAAVHHGVEGWVHRRAQRAGTRLPGLDEEVRAALGRHLRATSDLAVAHDALAGVGVPFLVVKGPALVDRLYAAPDLRSYIDLDILVDPRDLAAAVSALENHGFRVADANWPLLQESRVLELRLVSTTGGAVDLHWSLDKGPHRTDVSPPVPVLMERSMPWRFEGRDHRVLDWADTLVHLAVHAAGSGGHRLLWCADLRAAMTGAPEDAASVLARRVREWSAAPQLHLMLSRTQGALGVPVPAEWFDAIGGSSTWTRFIAGTDRVFPIERQGSGRGVTRLVARSTSTTAANSWKALASKSMAAIRSPLGPLDPDWLQDPDDPRSALHSVGGEAERRAFFAQVAETTRGTGR